MFYYQYSIMERILHILSISILIIAGLLLLSSGLGLFMDLGDILPVGLMHSYGGFSLIGLSIFLAILNLLLSKHPSYEYWFIILIGGMVGALYAV